MMYGSGMLRFIALDGAHACLGVVGSWLEFGGLG